MNKVNVFLVAAAIATGNLAAQSSRFESVNGKVEQRQNKFLTMPSGNNFIEGIAGDNEKATFEKKFSDNTTIKEKSDIVRHDGRIFSLPENSQQNMVKRSNLKQNVDLQNKKFETNLNVKKSTRDDVATIKLRVIGDPFFDGTGVQMILDADAEMFDIFWDNYGEWDYIYDLCEYKIPENASPDFSNIEVILDGEGSVDIPAGAYDFVFLNPITHYESIGVIIWAEDYESTLTHNFTFKAGFEYLFQVSANPTGVEYFPTYDVKLSEITLPFISTELSNQENVTVVIKNNGLKSIESDVKLSYIINDGEWTEPETLSLFLEPGDETTYIFYAKADFSEYGNYTVLAKIDGYDLDLFLENNYIKGVTKNPTPTELPFIEDFNKPESLQERWILSIPNSWSFMPCLGKFSYQDDADQFNGGGCIYASEAASQHLISYPVIIQESGTYNISFYATPAFNNECIKVLYGTSINPDEMNLLADFTNLEQSFDYDHNKILFTLNFANFNISTPGNYYFAFCYYSGDGGTRFDKVRISQGEYVGEPNIQVKRISPVSSCDMSNESVIKFEVYNKGNLDIEEFTLSYQIDEGQVVSQTYYETIGKNESISVSLDETADFSILKDYNFIMNASTPNEITVWDNKRELTLRHFKPITQLPFVTDYTNYLMYVLFDQEIIDWYPEIEDGWEKSVIINLVNGSILGTYKCNTKNVPLLSRCVYLQPDIYRFTYTFLVGLDFPEDFYVTYGKSGTDPLTWKPVKEYKNRMSSDLEEDFIIFEIEEEGEYIFAFFGFPDPDYPIYRSSIFIVGPLIINVLPEHDFCINNVESSFARLNPKYQTDGENTFTVNLENLGKTADENGKIKILLNDNEIFSQDFAFSEMGETVNIKLNPVFKTMHAGPLSLKFEASIQVGLSKEFEIFAEISDSTFAYDNIDGYFSEGLGFINGGGSFGLIYELQKSDMLTSIDVGLFDGTIYGDVYSNIGLSVYAVNKDLSLGKKFVEVVLPRTDGDNEKAITFDVPDTELTSGKYYFEVQQLDWTNICVAFDSDPKGLFYINQEGSLVKKTGLGYVHIRPNFGNPPVGMEELRVENGELRIYPNPATSELRVENGELKIEKINIYNAVGQIMMEVSNINSTSYRLNVEKLNAGLYFISVQTKDGVVNGKFVVK